MVIAAMKLKDTYTMEGKYDQPRQQVGHIFLPWCKYLCWSTNVHLVKAMVFPVVMYGCESWTIKKT